MELAVICSDYEAEDRPTATDVVSWIQDTLQNMAFDEDDPPKSKEEPKVEEVREEERRDELSGSEDQSDDAFVIMKLHESLRSSF